MIEIIMGKQKVPNSERTFIYFVRAGEFIKIGRSKTWKGRVMNMQVGSPHTIIVMLVLIAEPSLEAKLHLRFRADHYRGEWFHSGPALLAYIKENLSECVAKSGKNDLRSATPAAPNGKLAHGWDDL